MKQSLTVSGLIKELQDHPQGAEVFLVNQEKAQFDGVTRVFPMIQAVDEKIYVCLLGGGDILKI